MNLSSLPDVSDCKQCCGPKHAAKCDQAFNEIDFPGDPRTEGVRASWSSCWFFACKISEQSVSSASEMCASVE